MQVIKDANKKIPDDIAIIGFANESFGEYLTPSLFNSKSANCLHGRGSC
jgi:DNA-binding LacI/PurR family transcriptional regulator